MFIKCLELNKHTKKIELLEEKTGINWQISSKNPSRLFIWQVFFPENPHSYQFLWVTLGYAAKLSVLIHDIDYSFLKHYKCFSVSDTSRRD